MRFEHTIFISMSSMQIRNVLAFFDSLIVLNISHIQIIVNKKFP